ncbi:hypothetical protein PCANC_25702 [Puccinia coronata f. sp. avenae]|uniref:Uncharacterized protein n=1 Tax=Puccinia coronata f. sp. avenae TaxID=200324 RepID=A0A2N5S3F9_9BASI|nr:hypothetical protein PCANC_25702 [Puccinia coronata f. sp. avenae]
MEGIASASPIGSAARTWQTTNHVDATSKELGLAGSARGSSHRVVGETSVPLSHSELRQIPTIGSQPSSPGSFSSGSTTWHSSDEIVSPTSTASEESFSMNRGPSNTLAPNPRDPNSPGANQASSSGHHIASTVGKPTTIFNPMSYLEIIKSYSPFGRTRPALELTEGDATQLGWFLRDRGQQLNDEDIQVMNTYYETFSASDRTPTAVIKFEPDTNNLLADWEQRKPPVRGLFREFFREILSEQELKRRISVLAFQRKQYEILSGWNEHINYMSKRLDRPAEDITKAGDLIGGKRFSPPLESDKSRLTLNRIAEMEKEMPNIMNSWKKYLGQEYSSRVRLLETLSELDNPVTIELETISSWRAQRLDVNRMLKILDYRAKGEKFVGQGEHTAIQFQNLVSYDAAKNLFFDPSRNGIPWDESLEHHQLLRTPHDDKLRYIDFREKIKNPASLPIPSRLAGLTSQEPSSWNLVSRLKLRLKSKPKVTVIPESKPTPASEAKPRPSFSVYLVTGAAYVEGFPHPSTDTPHRVTLLQPQEVMSPDSD